MSVPKNAAGRALRDEHIRTVQQLLGDRELLARSLMRATGWTEGLTDAVLAAGIELGRLARRLETEPERLARLGSSTTNRGAGHYYLYRVVRESEPAPPHGPRQDHRWRWT